MSQRLLEREHELAVLASAISSAAEGSGSVAVVFGQAGLTVTEFRSNDYAFLSTQARDASEAYGVRSVSLLAVKPAS